MDKPHLFCGVGIQGPVVRILAVGGHQDSGGVWRIAHRHHHWVMAVHLPGQAQLHKIPGPELSQGAAIPHWPRSPLPLGKEIVEIGHSAPGRRAAGEAVVVPAKGGGVVHDSSTCIEALGGKIRTISPQILKVVVLWIPSVGPAVGVKDCGFPGL